MKAKLSLCRTVYSPALDADEWLAGWLHVPSILTTYDLAVLREADRNRISIIRAVGSDFAAAYPVIACRLLLRLVRFRVLTATTVSVAVFWDGAAYSLVDTDGSSEILTASNIRAIRGAYWLRNQRDGLPDDGGSNRLWNVWQFLPACRAQHPTCLSLIENGCVCRCFLFAGGISKHGHLRLYLDLCKMFVKGKAYHAVTYCFFGRGGSRRFVTSAVHRVKLTLFNRSAVIFLS
jgi:hypothetical protein